MSRQRKGWCAMVSERLSKREVYKTRWFSDEKYDSHAEKAIDKHVRRLVMLIKYIDAKGIMPLEKTERCVIRAFEKAEYLYYGLDEHGLMQVVKMERGNVKGRNGNK